MKHIHIKDYNLIRMFGNSAEWEKRAIWEDFSWFD